MAQNISTSQKKKLALNTYIKLSRAADSVGNSINGHLSEYDLTTSQFGVLEAVYHLGPMQTGELGAKILKSSGNMTLVIDNLVKRGLVVRERQEEDRRCIEIHLSEEGKALIDSIWAKHENGVLETFSALTVVEQEQLGALCRKLGLAQY